MKRKSIPLPQNCPFRLLTPEGTVDRCRHEPGHEGRPHSLRAEHILVWEAAHDFVPARCVIRWRNGYRADNRLPNLEVVTRKKLYREIYAGVAHRRKRGWRQTSDGWEKKCKVCKEWRPLDAFYRNRNTCKHCYGAEARRQGRERYGHKTRYGCVLVDGEHHHLGHFRDPLTEERRLAVLKYLAVLRYKEILEEEDGNHDRAQARWQILLNEIPPPRST